jgi:hypothetical protein
MNKYTEEESINKVINTLKESQQLWQTIHDISYRTNLPLEDVQKILFYKIRDQIVKSSALSKDGGGFFTTRERYQKEASGFEKLKGAFKNRLN